MWHPEIGPMAYAIVSRVRPKAMDTPRNPILSPASTALPQPPKTRTNVPTNSAQYRFIAHLLAAREGRVSTMAGQGNAVPREYPHHPHQDASLCSPVFFPEFTARDLALFVVYPEISLPYIYGVGQP